MTWSAVTLRSVSGFEIYRKVYSNVIQPDKVAELKRLIEAQAAEMPKPLWPALIEGPVRIDVPSNAPWVEGQELIYWAN